MANENHKPFNELAVGNIFSRVRLSVHGCPQVTITLNALHLTTEGPAPPGGLWPGPPSRTRDFTLQRIPRPVPASSPE